MMIHKCIASVFIVCLVNVNISLAQSSKKKDKDVRAYITTSFNLFHLSNINDSLTRQGMPGIKNFTNTLGLGFGYRSKRIGIGYEVLFDLISSKRNDYGQTKSNTYQFNLYGNYYFNPASLNKTFVSLGIGFVGKDATLIRDASGQTFNGLFNNNNAIYLDAFAPVLSLSAGIEMGKEKSPMKGVIKLGYALSPNVAWTNDVSDFVTMPVDNLGYFYINVNLAILGYSK